MADILLGMACTVVVLGLAGAFFIERQQRKHAQELALTTKERDLALELATVPLGSDGAITRVDGANVTRLARVEAKLHLLFDPLLKIEQREFAPHMAAWSQRWQQALREEPLDQGRLREMLDEMRRPDFQPVQRRYSELRVAVARLEQFLEERQHEQQDAQIEMRKFGQEMARKRAEYEQERWREPLKELSETRQAIILAQAELRDNPLAEELAGRFMQIYDLIKQYAPDQEVDPTVIASGVEQVGLGNFRKKTGINVNLG